MAPRHLMLIALVASLCDTAVGKSDNTSFQFCDAEGSYTNGSQYQKNVDQLLSNLSTAATNNGWFNTSTVGTAPDQVFGLIMCYADYNATQCRDCLTRAPAEIWPPCRYAKKLSAAFDGCLLLYSDVLFFDTADLSYNADLSYYHDPRYVLGSGRNVDDIASMNKTRWQLVNLLAGRAGDQHLRFMNGSQQHMDSKGNSQVEYGLAQCTRSLAPSECTRCLDYLLNWKPDGAVPPPFVSKGTKTPLVAVVTAGSVAFLIGLSVSFGLFLRRRQKRTNEMTEEELEDADLFNDEAMQSWPNGRPGYYSCRAGRRPRHSLFSSFGPTE